VTVEAEMGSGMSRGRRRGFGAGASGGMLPLLALQVLIEYGRAGASRPPVTAALLAGNALIYLRPGALDGILPSVTRVSFNPRLIVEVPNLTYSSVAQLENEIPVHVSKSHPCFSVDLRDRDLQTCSCWGYVVDKGEE
jgi:hypothetical protein